MITEYASWKAERFGILADTDPQTLSTADTAGSRSLFAAGSKYAWYLPDMRRDADAQAILASNKLHPIPSARPYQMWAYCFSVSQVSTKYWLTAHPWNGYLPRRSSVHAFRR